MTEREEIDGTLVAIEALTSVCEIMAKHLALSMGWDVARQVIEVCTEVRTTIDEIRESRA